MNKLIEFDVPGGTILVESSEENGNAVRGASVGRIAEKVGTSLSDALSVIRPVADAALDACRAMMVAPATVEVEFGVKFDAKVGVVISANAEGNLRIKLAWKPQSI